MVKSLTYFLSLLVMMFSMSCAQNEWYKKELSEETKKQYAPQVRGGRVYYYQGSVPEQLQIREAMKLDSTDAGTWREFGTSRVKRGILDETYYYYNEAVKRNPGKWAGFRGYLYLYFYRDFERAIADFNYNDEVLGEVSYSQGQHHDYMRGIAYYGLKEYETALRYFEKYTSAVTSEEGEEWVDVYAFLYKGLTFANLRQWNDAMDEFDKALKYYPNLSDCYYHKARILTYQKDYQEALEVLDQAELFLKQGYYHQRPYVEVLEQVYLQDIEELKKGD